MIIDSIGNAGRYYSVHPMFRAAFSYIDSTNMNDMQPGTYILEDSGIKAIFSNNKGVSTAESIMTFECHNKYIDIQLVIKGKETFGWKPRESCLAQKEEYNAEKDFLLFNDVPDTYFSLTDGQFVILFPEDVHAPMIGEDHIQKMVMKIPV